MVRGIALSRPVVQRAVERELRPLIRGVTVDQVIQAIEQDVDLWSVSDERVRALKEKLRSLNVRPEDVQKALTWFDVEWALRVLSETNPLAFSALINYPNRRGVTWLARQVEKVKAKVLEELTV